MTEKKCPDCQTTKPLDEFVRDGSRPDGRKTYCKVCWRTRCKQVPKEKQAQYMRKHILKQYGLTPDEYDTMLARQDGRCGICRTDKPGGGGSFAVDHCHDTGRVRGLLCFHCNTGIGKLGHSRDTLVAAINWLAA